MSREQERSSGLSELPHARDLVPEPSSEVVERSHEDIVADQLALVRDAVYNREEGQTEFSVSLAQPPKRETLDLLGERGYNYSTSSHLEIVNGERAESHNLVFSAGSLSESVRPRVTGRRVMFDPWFGRNPFNRIALW